MSEDEVDKDKRSCVQFNPEVDMSRPKFSVGQLFANAGVLKKAIREHAILTRRNIKLYTNEKERVRAKCYGSPQCDWVLYASKLAEKDSLIVKTYHIEHICPQVYYNQHIKADWISQKYLEKFRSNPTWPLESIRETIRTYLEAGVSRSKAYRAKRKATEMIDGSYREQFKGLWDYCNEVTKYNPGTTALMKLCEPIVGEEFPRFLRLYMCLGPLKNEFKTGCKKIVGLDGCFLKGPFPGQLLTTVGIDPDNGMYPFAWAVVEAENMLSWEWFINLLKENLQIEDQSEWTFISDQQKGLLSALETVLPLCEQRYCVMYMYKNFKKQFRSLDLKNATWNAAKAPNAIYFGRCMQQIKEDCVCAYEYLAKIPPSYWSRSHFSLKTRCDLLLNNYCEVFNGAIVNARDKSIITCLENIRNQVMQRIVKKRKEMEKWDGLLCSKIQAKLEKMKLKSCHYNCAWNGGSLYSVRAASGEGYVVDLHNKTCSCRKWDLCGIPCAHAISAIYNDMANGGNRGEPEQWVDECFRVETFKKVYDYLVNPLSGPNLWEPTNKGTILPPIYHKQPGMPKKLRRKDWDEVTQSTRGLPDGAGKLGRKGTVITCSKCGNAGHNSRGCRGQGCQPKTREPKKGNRSRGKVMGKVTTIGGHNTGKAGCTTQGSEKRMQPKKKKVTDPNSKGWLQPEAGRKKYPVMRNNVTSGQQCAT